MPETTPLSVTVLPLATEMVRLPGRTTSPLNVTFPLNVAVSPAAGAVPPQFAPSLHVVPSPAPDHVTVAAKRLPAAHGDKTKAPTIPIAAQVMFLLIMRRSFLCCYLKMMVKPARAIVTLKVVRPVVASSS